MPDGGAATEPVLSARKTRPVDTHVKAPPKSSMDQIHTIPIVCRPLLATAAATYSSYSSPCLHIHVQWPLHT